MSAESVAYATLKAASAVTALVGSGDAARIYPDVVPQEFALPAVSFQRVATEAVNTIHSTLLATRVTLDVWCMDEQRYAAETLADAAQAALVAAHFVLTNRRAELDYEAGIWIAALGTRLNFRQAHHSLLSRVGEGYTSPCSQSGQ